MVRQQTEKSILTEEKFYIDKTSELEQALKEYSCVYLEGAAASGKTTAVRMLCKKQENIPVLTVSAGKETLEEYSGKIFSFREKNAQTENQNGWIVVEDFPGTLSGKEEKLFLSLISQISSEERLILEGREELPEVFLDFLWKGKLQLLPQEILRLSREEVARLSGERNSFLNPSELYETTGGWAGCVDLLLRMTSRSFRHTGMCHSVQHILQKFEVQDYLEQEILQKLQPKEKEIFQYMEFCPWMEPELCREVFQLPDVKRTLEALQRKGLLTRCCQNRLWKRIPLFESFNVETGIEKKAKLKKAGEWFERNGFPEQALYCLNEACDCGGYSKCLKGYYKDIPFSGIELSDFFLQQDSAPENCYLRGMKAILDHNWTALEDEIRLVEKQMDVLSAGKQKSNARKASQKRTNIEETPESERLFDESMEELRKTAEIWINLTFVNPLISLDDWMENLKQAAKAYGPMRLYHILGGSCTFLCGLRDLSGLFVGGKAVENKLAKLWKSSLGPEEWKEYQLARIEFYLETKQQHKIQEEDWEMLLNMETSELWQILLVRYWLLIKVRRSNLSKEAADTEEIVRSVLENEENTICKKVLKAMDSLRNSNGGEKILFTWLKDKKVQCLGNIREDNFGMWYLRAIACYEVQQYDRAEKILNKLIPYVRSGRKSRVLAECLFQHAALEWSKGNRKKSLQDTVESFLMTGEFRYFKFYTQYGRNGYEVLEEYVVWLNSNLSETRKRRRKYNYGNILNMPFEDYINTVLREAKKNKGQMTGKKIGDTQESLTVTEIIVLKELSTGMTNEEICADLNLKLSTVKCHIYNIYRKLGVKSRVQALLVGKERGLISKE